MKRDWCNKEFRRLVAIGDSITAGGWASCREKCWVELVVRQINELQAKPVTLVNVGIGANQLTPLSPAYQVSSKPCGMERIDRDIIANDPDLLIIAFGTNDARGGTPVEVYQAELEKTINNIRGKINPLIVLVGPYHIFDFELGSPHFNKADNTLYDTYNAATQATAEKCDCLFVDVRSALNFANWLVHHDGVHLNDAGHRVVANRIVEVLLGNCSGMALHTQKMEEQIPPWRDESTLTND